MTALGLEGFPDPGTIVLLDDIGAAIIGVPAPAEGKEPGVRGEARAAAHAPAQAPEPLCFLHLSPPSQASRQISFSALSAFGRCPRRYYLERILGLGFLATPAAGEGDGDAPGREEDLLDDAEAYMGRDVGLLVHALLEQIELTAAEHPSREDLLTRAATVAANIGLRLSAGGIERATELAEAFWDSPLAGDPEIGSALREEPFFFLQGDMTMHGVMDLLCREGQRWRIVDYKSNSARGPLTG